MKSFASVFGIAFCTFGTNVPVLTRCHGAGKNPLHKNLGQSCFPDPTWFPGCRIDTIIAGHTHRPVYENLSLTERLLLEYGKGTDKIEQKFKADNSYYNTGSCVHPRCITGIEITGSGSDMAITLIKWGYAVQPGAEKDGRNVEYNMMIAREVLEQ